MFANEPAVPHSSHTERGITGFAAAATGVDSMSDVLRVAVVDDHVTLADLLVRALDSEPGLSAVGSAHDGAEARELVERTRPDVLVMDVGLHEEDGLDLTAELLQDNPGMRVVVLTAQSSGDLVHRAVAAGAASLIPKTGSLDELVSAVRNAPRNGLSVHPELLQCLVSEPRRVVGKPALTAREADVLRLMAEGVPARQIGRTLGISEHTVRGHIKKLLLKLNAHSQLEAVAEATRRGWV